MLSVQNRGRRMPPAAGRRAKPIANAAASGGPAGLRRRRVEDARRRSSYEPPTQSLPPSPQPSPGGRGDLHLLSYKGATPSQLEDVVAAVHVQHLAGHGGGEVAEQTEGGPAEAGYLRADGNKFTRHSGRWGAGRAMRNPAGRALYRARRARARFPRRNVAFQAAQAIPLPPFPLWKSGHPAGYNPECRTVHAYR